jgi:hypothetical protein
MVELPTTLRREVAHKAASGAAGDAMAALLRSVRGAGAHLGGTPRRVAARRGSGQRLRFAVCGCGRRLPSLLLFLALLRTPPFLLHCIAYRFVML